MNFENVKCDGCGKMIEKGQDVVVCPECGTAQHRACYEKNGKCVNYEKHADGFIWENENQNQEQKKAAQTVCPNCGASFNEPKTTCPNCGFDRNKEKDDLKSRQQAERQQLEELMQQSEEGELPDLDKLIDIRVNTVAPGITEQQRKEQLCGHDIGTTASFISSSVSSYVKKFRAIEHENERTFNWGAFFFAPYWFFWRKLYKEGIAVLGVSIILDLLCLKPNETFMNMYSAMMQALAGQPSAQVDVSALLKATIPIYILAGLSLIMKFVIGFTADRLYHKYCTNSLNEIDRLKAENNTDAVTYFVKKSGVSMLFAAVSFVVCIAVEYILSGFII